MLKHQSKDLASQDTHFSDSRRSFLKKSATSVTLGVSGVIAAPFVHAQSKVTLKFLNSETSAANQKVLKDACDEYESKFGIKTIIDSTPISGAHPKVLAAVRAGRPYDLSTQGFIANILQYADAGILEPLTEFVNKYTWGNYSIWKYKGDVWFYPYDYNLATMYYRKDLYAKHGLRVPNTWDELLKNCQALAVSENGMVQRGGCVIPIQSDSSTNWASFGSLFAEVPKFFDDKWNVILDKGAALKGAAGFLDLYAELYKTMPPGMNTVSYAQMMSLFVTGKTAHTLYSGRLVEAIEAHSPELSDKFGIFALPDKSGKRKALTTAYDSFLLFKTKQTEEGFKFLKWFIDNYYIKWLLAAWMNSQPARLDVYDDPRWKNNPMIKKYWSTMTEMKSFIDNGSPTLIDAIELSGPSVALLPCKIFDANIMPEMLQNRVLKGMASADCVKNAANRMRKLA